MVNIIQLNIGKRVLAVNEIKLRLANKEAEILLIQEPKLTNKVIKGFYGGKTL